MSGPKVVRIVTREEIIAICEGHLQRLEQASARWEKQARKLGELQDSEHAATQSRCNRLRMLLAEDRLAELQKQVPIEIEYLQRDLAEREQRAVLRATQERQNRRRQQENIVVLLEALAGNAATPVELRRQLETAARDGIPADVDVLLAKGLAYLAKVPVIDNLSDEQRDLAQRLQTGEPTVAFAEWRALHEMSTSRDERLLRIDSYIAELQLLQGDECVRPFLLQLNNVEAEVRTAQRNLLLDSLVLNLAQSTRDYRQKRILIVILEDLASEVAALPGTLHANLLRRVADAITGVDFSRSAELTEECRKVITTHLEQQAAMARREAILAGLANLGYEVREGMATAWAETGRVVLRKTATPGYGVELGGKADNGRLQVRAVALTSNHDKLRDRDIETIWCGEFERLQRLLRAQGNDMNVVQAMAVGETPLKEIAMDTGERSSASPSQNANRS
jgi:hypothetical protein